MSISLKTETPSQRITLIYVRNFKFSGQTADTPIHLWNQRRIQAMSNNKFLKYVSS